MEECVETADFGGEYFVELLSGFLFDEAVLQDAGTVDDTGDGAEGVAGFVDGGGDGGGIADVERAVEDGGAGGLDLLEVVEDFAVAEEAAVLFFDGAWGCAEGVCSEGFFDLAFIGEGGEPCGVGGGERAASEEEEFAAVGFGEGKGNGGGDTACAAGDDDDIVSGERGLTDFAVEGFTDEAGFAAAVGGDTDFGGSFEEEFFGDLLSDGGEVVGEVQREIQRFAGDFGPFVGSGFDKAGEATGEGVFGGMAVEGEAAIHGGSAGEESGVGFAGVAECGCGALDELESVLDEFVGRMRGRDDEEAEEGGGGGGAGASRGTRMGLRLCGGLRSALQIWGERSVPSSVIQRVAAAGRWRVGRVVEVRGTTVRSWRSRGGGILNFEL